MYNVLVADCPWKFGDTLPGDTRGAERQYPCLSVEELCKFPLPSLADDATLFFWRVASMQQEALNVIQAWGFPPPQSEIVWLKKTKYGKRWFGMGRTVRMEHEVCLISYRGRAKTLSNSERSTFETDLDADGFEDRVGKHSQKPEFFYELVEHLRAGPYCELFARRVRDRWTCLGNEV